MGPLKRICILLLPQCLFGGLLSALAGLFLVGRIDAMLDTSGLFGFFAVVPTFERADEVAGNAAEALKEDIPFGFKAATARATIALDDAGETADRVAVDGVVDGAVADAGFFHMADDGLKSFNIIGRIAVELDVGNMTGVAEIVERGLLIDFLKGGNIVVDRNME